MKKVVINYPRVGEFIAKRAHCTYNPMTDNTVAVIDEDYSLGDPQHICGGVLFTNYTGASIWVHMAGNGGAWASSTFLWCVFHYAFEQLGVRRLYGVVESANEHALKVDLRLGFEIATTLPDVFASGPATVVYMTPEMCRWLKVKPRTLMAAR